ncbi:MAG: penicillin-binding protein 1C [Deltaproteobacteria bacterium]|nr:penicillin-binding protein 1C [Deltaproteobacteria bacterium]
MRLPRARTLARGALSAAGLALLAAAAFVAWPVPEVLLAREGVVSLRFTDREDGTLRELRSREDGRSVPLPPGELLPPRARQAFLAAEDRRFFEHPGVDPWALGRAVFQNLRAWRIVSGASTITQQLARRLAPHERTLAGKIQEALWALRLSAHLPKERVLREYLDRVPLGNSTFGIEAASQLYFGRPASSLSAGQAALLAGMARSPARYDPYRHPEASQARMRAVLRAMRDAGALDADQERVAAAAPLDLVPPERAFRAPHLVTSLSQRLAGLGLDSASEISTALDPALQADIETLIAEELSGLGARRVSQAAAIVVDNPSGEVLAYVGSADFLDEARGGQNDGARALRQPGSALKPFAYGLALARGMTAATVLSDVETHLATPTGDYVPRNYDRRVHGPVRLRAALANSYNVPAVRLAEKLGPPAVLEILRRAGFESLDRDAAHYGVGVVLGNGDVNLYELARAFRGLARGGVSGSLKPIREARDAAGQPLPLPEEMASQRFLPESSVALLTDILSDEGARAPAFGLDNALRLPFPTAAKTGTSRAYVDNWTAGYTRERTVAVWVGNFDGTPMRGVSGITGAAPLFRRIMIRAMRGVPRAPLVDRSRFEPVDICALSGRRAGPACPSALHEVFLPGTAPAESCPMHRMVAAASGQRRVLDVGPEFYAWAHGEGLESVEVSAHSPTGSSSGRLLLPGEGDEYVIDPGIPEESQTIPVRALAPPGVAELELRGADGVVLLQLRPPFSARLPARLGEHRVELWVPGAERPVSAARYTVH